VGDPGLYASLAISPDEKRLVFGRVDRQDSATRNLWLYEFARGVAAPLTSGKVANWSPQLCLLPLNSGSADRKLIPLESSEFHTNSKRAFLRIAIGSPIHRMIPAGTKSMCGRLRFPPQQERQMQKGRP
jgi:hypothetical protein